ncbi:YccS family putative transporter [Xylophilus sp.]|uniref:YccS family putative transporter n=1 Tax=Xylophilus sp. TaxID=2653893 RepID=UPI002D7FBD10|nr:YccS family putative transporter [Xylophilus sp.]
MNTTWWRRLWAQDAFVYGLRVFVALAGAMALCWHLDRLPLVAPVFLGTIASAIAETDDNWRGRLRALLVTLLSFGVAAASVEVLFDRPWAFVGGLTLATFGLTLLGAVGERYRAIAQATMILAIYTALSVEPDALRAQPHWRGAFWQVPTLLLAGAAWYGLLSVAWCALFPHQPVRQNLVRLYEALGDYLRLKASLFEPVRGVDVERRRLALAQYNGRVVAALNATKESIFSRLGRRATLAPTGRMLQHLNLYFIAQDVHERASSSHYHYNAWADVFFHSDVLYRAQRVLALQGAACTGLAEALGNHLPLAHDGAAPRALDDLRGAIDHLAAQAQPAWARPLRSLRALARNLATLDAQLAAAATPGAGGLHADFSLFDRTPRSLADAWARVRAQLRLSSPLLRHAVRLSLALAAGYGVMQLSDPHHGYWIVMTTLFVCQQSYGATLAKVSQRVAGTVAGLVAGWAVMRLFPGAAVQALFIVAAGVLFFATRTARYLVATAAITLLVLLSFNQISGDAYTLIVPRMVDTLVGSAIAVSAVFLILPDWQGRRLHEVAAQALAANGAYLREIMSQYGSGKDDDLDYRLARRNAHNADSALSAALSQLFKEPGFVRRHAAAGMRLLVLSHTLLSYLSALGAHRSRVETGGLVGEAAELAAARLEALAASLRRRSANAVDAGDGAAQSLAARLEQAGDDDAAAPDDEQRLVLAQLALVCRQLPALGDVVAALLRGEGEYMAEVSK